MRIRVSRGRGRRKYFQARPRAKQPIVRVFYIQLHTYRQHRHPIHVTALRHSFKLFLQHTRERFRQLKVNGGMHRQVTHYASQVLHHASHIPRHSSHVTRHTSHNRHRTLLHAHRTRHAKHHATRHESSTRNFIYTSWIEAHPCLLRLPRPHRFTRVSVCMHASP